MRIALTLSKKNPIYEGLGIKFFHHFLFIGATMRKGYWRKYDMWDASDGFFYSSLRHPDGKVEKIKVRSMVGIIPFFACDVWDEKEFEQFPEFYEAYRWLTQKRPSLTKNAIQEITYDGGTKHVLSLLGSHELEHFLKVIWDPNEFRSDYGLRSLSKYHEKKPAKLHDLTLAYEPGEAQEKIKGGNSNWRGPVWFPLNFLFIDTLKKLHGAFNDTLRISIKNEAPITLEEMADSCAEKLLSLFKVNKEGKRPIHGDCSTCNSDPHFKDHILFYEHFHGDTGRGLGASHQTGWTALIASLINNKKIKKPG